MSPRFDEAARAPAPQLADLASVALAVYAVVALQSNLAVWLFTAGVAPLPPLVALLVFAVPALPLLLSRRGWRTASRSRLLGWCLGYVLATSIAFFASRPNEVVVGELRLRLLSTLVLAGAVLTFASPFARRAARRAVAASVVVASGFALYDLSHPFTFSPILGRGAGLYVNPNIAGAAIILGLLLGIGVLPRRWRAPYALAAAVGVLSTVSRSSLLALALAVVWLMLTGQLRALRLARVILAALAVTLVALLPGGRLATLWQTAQIGLAQVGTLSRITQARSTIATGDESAEERAALVRAAWRLFLDHPLTGDGVASTLDWEYRTSTHNLYVRHLAEYGVLGAVLMPWLAWAIARRRGGPAPHLAVGVGAFTLYWSAFSHNLLDEPYFLLSMALAANLTAEDGAADAWEDGVAAVAASADAAEGVLVAAVPEAAAVVTHERPLHREA